jgi:colanic acid/amylovoran biosynthesis glycosyltransferase
VQKKVVYKLKEFPTPSETFVVSNIVSAIEAGFEVEIVTDVLHPLSYSSQPELIEKYRLRERTYLTETTETYNRLLLHPLYLYYFLKFCIQKRRIDLSFMKILGFYRNFRKNTVFHVHFGTSVPPLHYLKQIGFLQSDIVVTFHGYGAHYLATAETGPRLIHFYNHHVSRVTVNSAYLKKMLLKKGIREDLIEIIPIGIDSEVFKTASPKTSTGIFKVITVGRFIPLKGQHLGMQVVKQLLDRGLQLQYTLVGDGPEFKKLKTMAIDLDIEDHIVFAGKKNQTEIKSLLEEQDLFLMTSTLGKDGRREAFGLVSLEAQAMAVPVIGFDSGGFPETIKDGQTGILVPDGDVTAMAREIELFYKDRDRLTTMGAEAQAYVREQFSKAKTTDKYLDLY